MHSSTGEFTGYVGLTPQTFEAPFNPSVEVGWRLAHEFWGRGYAPEAGQAALDYAFDMIGLAEVVSFTSMTNLRSQRVMQKLGMTHDPAEDFDHPNLPEGDPLRPHVLYRISRPEREPGRPHRGETERRPRCGEGGSDDARITRM